MIKYIRNIIKLFRKKNLEYDINNWLKFQSFNKYIIKKS